MVDQFEEMAAQLGKSPTLPTGDLRLPTGLPEKAVSPLDPYRTDATTLATIKLDGQTVAGIKSFSYSSDVLALGDPFSVAIPDPRGEHKGKFPPGSAVQLYLASPYVRGGVQTLKATGIVTRRVRTSEGGAGTTIALTCADRGWHLTHNDAPLYRDLRGIRLPALARKLIERDAAAWGFDLDKIRDDNSDSRTGRQGRRRATRQEATFALRPKATLSVYDVIETCPGEKIADILIRYARYEKLLVNVGWDGQLQFFRPDYDRDVKFKIEYHREGTREAARNNAKRATVTDDANSLYTSCLCVGEVIYQPPAQTTGQAQKLDKAGNPVMGDIHAGNRYGRWPLSGESDVLPFPHRKIFADSEQMSSAMSQWRAEWAYERGQFDSQSFVYLVRGHVQGDNWWESDELVDIDDTVNGVAGRHYISSVRCNRDNQTGDTTEVTCRTLGLLGG